MSEAIILEAIQTLESFLVEASYLDSDGERITKEAINELRMTLDFLRDKESGERMKLNYLLADYVEIATELTRKNIATYLYNVTMALGDLRKMKNRMMEFGAGEGLTGPQSVGDEGHVVVGLEKDVRQLIGRVVVNEERGKGQVVSRIKGMLGAGKTTLARQVYNHAVIVEKFKLRAWISVSRYTSTKEVLVKLVQQLLEYEGDSLLVEEMDNRSLRRMLAEHLQGMSFLIVVDNLLPEMDFESFLISLARNDALQNLETLTYISIYDWTYEVSSLEKMTCLRKLGVEEVDEKSNVGKLFASLAKLMSFEHLTLRGFRFRSMSYLDEIGDLNRFYKLRLDGRLARLPSANKYMVILALVLVNTCLDEDPMPLLGGMPFLQQLKLRNAYTGLEMKVIHTGFFQLYVLRINELWNLRNIQVGKGAMSKLSQLEIMNCPHLETLPEEIGSMENLSKFKMVTTKHIAAKIRNSSFISKIVEVDISP